MYVVVADPAIEDFKDSALHYLDRADAIVEIAREGAPVWRGVSGRLWTAKPRFTVRPGEYASAELAGFVRLRLDRG